MVTPAFFIFLYHEIKALRAVSSNEIEPGINNHTKDDYIYELGRSFPLTITTTINKGIKEIFKGGVYFQVSLYRFY